MNNIADRIAEIRSRFATTTSVSRAAGNADFASLLASTVAGTTKTSDTDTSALLSSLTSSTNAVDPSAYTALAKLMRANTPVAATGTSIGSAAASPGAPPAGFDQYSSAIAQVATDEGVPASLLGALVWSESSFNANAVSPVGARGLTQLMPATASGLGVDIDNPMDNLRGGARYLRQMLDRFGATDLALAAYNAGPGAVERANGIPPYPETQSYVARVMARANTLAGASA